MITEKALMEFAQKNDVKEDNMEQNTIQMKIFLEE